MGYDSDVHHVRDVLMEVVSANDLVLKRPEPKILFMRFGADALEFEVRAILKRCEYGDNGDFGFEPCDCWAV